MVKVFKDEEISTEILKEKTIAIIGYGSQGRAQALNLRDSGFNIILGLREGGPSWQRAESEGFNVFTIDEASSRGDIVHILIPDPVQPYVYRQFIEPNLKEGAALGFSHAFNIHYKQIIPPPNCDVFLIAPKAPGITVRETYVRGSGVPGLVAVYQDSSGYAWDIALAMGKGIGLSRCGLIETTFKEEVETDLFGEQVVLCGGVTELIKAGFETLVEAGYQPEIAYYECLNELKLIVDLIWSKGIMGMWQNVSDTAKYGGLTRGPVVIDESVRARMKKILRDIQSGVFAREWILEYQSKMPVLNSLMEVAEKHPIEDVGKRLRKLAGMEE
ncbi:MAG TPA: ketol-acid reductoisomerase [Candidatus Bathyarchaeota archaeon]|nr:ketol-acid reductoisomerase [Candidatus Bathyarchaeota archaeon]